MSQTSTDKANLNERERAVEIAWIRDNLYWLWPVAQAMFQDSGRGAILLLTTSPLVLGVGQPFIYFGQELLDVLGNADAKRMVLEYDPYIELVLVVMKWSGHESVYRVQYRHRAGEGDLFDLGQMVETPGAHAILTLADISPLELLKRHVQGDWGDLSAEDKTANAEALKQGSRVLSVYTLPSQQKVWIITEVDRSATTILLPEEY